MSASTLAILFFMTAFWVLGPFASIAIQGYVLFYTRYYPWVIAYILWCVYDRRPSTRVSRRSDWLRSLKFWEYYRDYFPAKLVKTADLDPSRNYVIGLHPHGILVAGGIHFVTESTSFSKEFPGIKTFMLVHDFLVSFSFAREYAIPLGFASVGKATFDYLLRQGSRGNALCLVPGGVREMNGTKQGKVVDLVLLNRKGFVREAIKNGASLVPAYTFGEQDLFDVDEFAPGSLLAKLQQLCNKYLHLPLFKATGRVGLLLPLRKPITTVIGAPIQTERDPLPSKEDIDKVHAAYVKQLGELFESHKEKYGGKDLTLRFS